MRLRRSIVLFGLVSPALLAQSTGPAQLILQGIVSTTGERNVEHPAWFVLMCTRGAGAALSLQLKVDQSSAPHFDFDAFEGPDAPASRLPSAHLQVNDIAQAPTAVSGWWSGETNETTHRFVFGVATTLGKRGPITKMIYALEQPDAVLAWVQDSADVHAPSLHARFTLDATQRKQLQTLAAPCLPRG
jgi:hypothetical protein